MSRKERLVVILQARIAAANGDVAAARALFASVGIMYDAAAVRS